MHSARPSVNAISRTLNKKIDMETTTTQSETSAGADNANSIASPEPSTHAADFAAPEKCTQNGCSNVGIHHVGIHVKDPLLSAQFYRDILGMQLVGGSPADTPGLGASAFLTSRPGEESHEIALFSQPQFRHVAFKVASLAELKRLYRLVLERELPIKLTSDHGVSLAFYFDDPDGNMIEVYWPTGRHVKQPFLKPLDLNQSDETILASIATEAVLPLEIPF
jgi:catechol-2,3-dioxygenase